jgi:1,4-alpha-glucan branching enzyme
MVESGWQARNGDVAAIVAARHEDPFAVLGQHQTPSGPVVRAFVPYAETLHAVAPDGTEVALEGRPEPGFFEGLVPDGHIRYRLRAATGGGTWELDNPYSFGPVLGAIDDHLFVEGTHQKLYRQFGAHARRHDGVDGVHFAVWAPNARRVSVVGTFNDWDGRRLQMRKRIESGLWEIFAPGVAPGTIYKYEILGRDGALQPLKADPVGLQGELRPSTSSVVAAPTPFAWSDGRFLAERGLGDKRRKPLSFYEVHLGSWRRGEGNGFLSYDEIADQLIPYAVDMGFTHLELMPISEHPLDASWGYQPVGLFAPTRRFGSPEDFARFVDRAHAAGLGVVIDWVPAHFPIDVHGLARFDGTPLYEYADPRRGFHPDWNTAIYDFARREVAGMLAANALYWLDHFHLDGLRVDAVASMLYLDYSRAAGEWLPNWDGGNDNREAVEFLKRVNQLVYATHPGAMTIAEESTSWSGVSRPVHAGGLGFGFKWNMGWMHDTLDFMAQDPLHRRWHYDRMTFGLLYAFSENFVLPLSHDEVVHGKKSIVSKMPGDEWQRFANVRAYYGFMWGHPGKKLLFMGSEFGQTAEWNFDQSLDWHLLRYDIHRGVQDLIRDLNGIYRATPALHARDCEPEGFRWVVADDHANSVLAWLRFGEPGDAPVAVVSNFTPVPLDNYRIGLPLSGRWEEILNTDAGPYGGSNLGNLGGVMAKAEPSHGLPASAEMVLPPLATVFLRYAGTDTS